MMLQTPKFLIASVAAALATIFFPVAIGLYACFQGRSSLDDAPFIAGRILLSSMPALFVIILAAWYSITKGLSYFNALTRRNLLVICLVFNFTHGCYSRLMAISGSVLLMQSFPLSCFLALRLLVWGWGCLFGGQ